MVLSVQELILGGAETECSVNYDSVIITHFFYILVTSRRKTYTSITLVNSICNKVSAPLVATLSCDNLNEINLMFIMILH